MAISNYNYKYEFCILKDSTQEFQGSTPVLSPKFTITVNLNEFPNNGFLIRFWYIKVSHWHRIRWDESISASTGIQQETQVYKDDLNMKKGIKYL